jgi:hypothetical protein
LHPVGDNDSAPHLRAGEFAIVDLGDREPEHGALFVIEYSAGTPRARRTIVEILRRQHTAPGRKPFIGWWSGPLVRARSVAEVHAEIREGRISACVDDPLLVDDMREARRGRVIGVFRLSGASANAVPPARNVRDRNNPLPSNDATMPRLAAGRAQS